MNLSAAELMEFIGGELEGDPNVIVSKPAGIEDADRDCVSFLSNEKYIPLLNHTKAGIVLIDRNLSVKKPLSSTLLRVNDINQAKRKLLQKFSLQSQISLEISKLANISHAAHIAKEVAIGDFTVIKEGAFIDEKCIIFDQVYIGRNVKIGKRCILYPGVKVHQGVTIGNDVVIKSNAVIGGEGFGFVKENESFIKLHHLGDVQIGDRVEIGSNTVIDKATLGSTFIGEGVKLDNLIQVGHNVVIEKNTVIAAQTGISGSVKIGKNSEIGGQVGIAGHLKIEEGTRIQGKSGIAKDVCQKGKKLYGYPAIDYFNYLRSYSIFKALPKILKELQTLQKEVNILKDRLKKKDI